MPYTTEIQVRFRDFDPMRHVNNALYVTYLEQARAAFYDEVVGVPLDEVDSVTVELSVGELGESSIPMEYEIRAGETRYATARTVQVYVDRETGGGGIAARPRRPPRATADRRPRLAEELPFASGLSDARADGLVVAVL